MDLMETVNLALETHDVTDLLKAVEDLCVYLAVVQVSDRMWDCELCGNSIHAEDSRDALENLEHKLDCPMKKFLSP